MNAASREKEINALLKDIMQRDNDSNHLDRSICNDVTFGEKNYDASELKSANAVS